MYSESAFYCLVSLGRCDRQRYGFEWKRRSSVHSPITVATHAWCLVRPLHKLVLVEGLAPTRLSAADFESAAASITPYQHIAISGFPARFPDNTILASSLETRLGRCRCLTDGATYILRSKTRP